MMPSDMNLRVGDSVAGFNNKILISKKGFGVGKNKLVNKKNNLIVIKPVIKTVNKPVTKTTGAANKPVIKTINKPAIESFTKEA